MALNDSNFLIWYPAGESQFLPLLPRPFVREPDVLSPVVWLVPGETISFYINSTNNTAPAGPIQLLHEQYGNVALDLDQSINIITFPGGQHTYGSIVVPAVTGIVPANFDLTDFDPTDFQTQSLFAQGLSEGFVRLKIGDYVSQWLWLSSPENANDRTAVVKFRNNSRLMNYRYSYLPGNFYQQFRIRLAVRSEEPELNKTTYRGSTTGKTRHLYSEPRQIVTFLAPEYDRNGHRAIVNMMEHDALFINDQPFAFATGYKSNMNQGDVLSDGEFAVSDEAYATLHRS